MAAAAEDIRVRRDALRAMERRRRINMAFFLGPAFLVVGLFFVVPVIVDIVISFTDLGRDLRVTEISTDNYERALGVGDTRRDRQLPGNHRADRHLCRRNAPDLQHDLRPDPRTDHDGPALGIRHVLPRRLALAQNESVRGLRDSLDLVDPRR